MKNIFEKNNKRLKLQIKVIPNSSKNEIIFEQNFVKIKLTAPPVENKANKALIEFLAKKLKTAKSNIQIIKGETSKEKTLLISSIDEKTFKEKFNFK
ncbi:MAG TPA: DUF167 domain-containing protein [Candidatus Gastranaerophilaceae bacterium]|nr:DUF167 domain-containing protein [Candidatus Gastranaerophilaceae bacterium]